MDTNAASTTAIKKARVTDRWLAIQDEYYAKRRLPEATPAGAEGRTFCFRVEFEHDLYPLSHMLRWAVETWWQSPVCPWGDADVKMTLKPDTLSLPELRWLVDRVGDCHVAVETVELEASYTGERKYQTDEDLEMLVPNEAALKASIDGLGDFQETLEFTTKRAADAEAQIDSVLLELRQKAFTAAMRKRKSKPTVKPRVTVSTSHRSKRAST